MSICFAALKACETSSCHTPYHCLLSHHSPSANILHALSTWSERFHYIGIGWYSHGTWPVVIRAVRAAVLYCRNAVAQDLGQRDMLVNLQSWSVLRLTALLTWAAALAKDIWIPVIGGVIYIWCHKKRASPKRPVSALVSRR